MARINDGPRVRRLSSAALSLLMRMCERGAAISYTQATGSYRLCVGDVVEYSVRASTVTVLAAPRLIVRERESSPKFVISERARLFLRTHLRERCEALGHDRFACTDPVCVFDPFAAVR